MTRRQKKPGDFLKNRYKRKNLAKNVIKSNWLLQVEREKSKRGIGAEVTQLMQVFNAAQETSHYCVKLEGSYLIKP